MFLVSSSGTVPDFPRRCLSVVLRLHGQGSAYVPFTSRGHDCQVCISACGLSTSLRYPISSSSQCCLCLNRQRTSTSCFRHSGLSSESPPFSLFAGFLPVSKIGVSSTPSAFAGESESLQQQAHHQLVWNQGCDEWSVQQFKVLGVDWRTMLVLSAFFSRPENRLLAWVYWDILRQLVIRSNSVCGSRTTLSDS